MVDRLHLPPAAAGPARSAPAPAPRDTTPVSPPSGSDTFKADSLPGNQYDLPAPRNKDKWDNDFRRDALKYGQKGWARYGDLIKDVAARQHIDPYVLGAYVWNESNFNPNQDYSAGGMHAVGL